MNKLFLTLIAGASLLLTSPLNAQVLLELVNPSTSTSSEILTSPAETNFTLNIEVQYLTGTQALAGFDLTLASLPTGITLTSFTQVLPNFTPNDNSPTSFLYSAADNSPNQDVTINATPISILQANFSTTSALAAGTYHIDFIAPGFFQGLDDDNGNRISYTDEEATLVVENAPEPKTTILLLCGLAIILSRGIFKRVLSLLY